MTKAAKHNPESAAQYRLAQAVLSGTARDSRMSKKAAQEIVDATSKAQRSKWSKRNPEDAAAAMHEAFTGSPSTETLEFVEEEVWHSNLAGLGILVELRIVTLDGYEGEISFEEGKTYLCCNEDGEQLYICGDSQGIDLKAWHIKGHDAKKECVVLGEITHVTYHAKKIFSGKAEEHDYEHAFGEEGGCLPYLIYDARNEKLKIAGGSYYIPKPLLETSPGITD